MQDHRQPVLGRELVQLFVQDDLQFLNVDAFLTAIVVAIAVAVPIPIIRSVGFLARQAALPGPADVEGNAAGDLLEPGADVTYALAVSFAVGGEAEENSLGGVFCVVGIASGLEADAEHHRRVTAHDLLERALPAGELELLQQVDCVAGGCEDSAPVPVPQDHHPPKSVRCRGRYKFPPRDGRRAMLPVRIVGALSRGSL